MGISYVSESLSWLDGEKERIEYIKPKMLLNDIGAGTPHFLFEKRFVGVLGCLASLDPCCILLLVRLQSTPGSTGFIKVMTHKHLLSALVPIKSDASFYYFVNDFCRC